MPRPLSSQPHLLLAIDRYLGIPLCWCLTTWRRLAGPPPPPPGELRARPLIFLKLAEQGSTVLAFDALAEAVRRVGRENVYFVAFAENRFVLDLLRIVPEENVLVVDMAGPRRMWTSGWRMLRRARRLRPAATIDLEFFARATALLGYLIGAGRRIGFHTYFGEGPYRGDLYTHRVLYNPQLHTSETFLSLVHALDLSPTALPTFNFRPPAPAALPSFLPGENETREVRALLERAGGAGSALILLNANCSDLLPLRRWADANYIALAKDLLATDPRIRVAFTGSAAEAPRVAELASAVGSPRAFTLAGQTTLRQLLVLYLLADVLVTNDSGPAHFAALTPIDVVALFGPETPLLFAAHGPRSHPVWAGIACSPCVNAFNSRQSACRNNLCLQAISVPQVAALVREILERRGRAGSAPAPRQAV